MNLLASPVALLLGVLTWSFLECPPVSSTHPSHDIFIAFLFQACVDPVRSGVVNPGRHGDRPLPEQRFPGLDPSLNATDTLPEMPNRTCVESQGYNHGVTSPLWDWVFATSRLVPVVVVPNKLALAWLLDAATGDLKPEYAGIFRLRVFVGRQSEMELRSKGVEAC
jgi:hypothetical protein